MEARLLRRRTWDAAILTTACIAIALLSTSCGGGATEAIPESTNNPVPTITSLSPASATAGAAAQTLYIIGTGFVSTSTVTYNGVAHPATFVSTSELTIQLTASDQATVGTYVVVVTNPGSGGGASNAVNFSVVHWIGLSWTASVTPPAVGGYNVFRNANSGSSGPPWVQLNTTPITCTTPTCSFMDTNNGAGLSNGVEYWYVVTAVGSDGVTQSADSNVATATIP